MRFGHPVANILWGLLIGCMPLGCNTDRPAVDRDDPEALAGSVGRILCAEHGQRLEAIRDNLDETLAIHAARVEVFGADDEIAKVTEQLEALARVFQDDLQRLEKCTIEVSSPQPLEDNRAHIALQVIRRDIGTSDEGVGVVETRESILLTVERQTDDNWRIIHSNVDLRHPAGAVRSLLD